MFVDLGGESGAVPVQGAIADGDCVCCAAKFGGAAFGHCPTAAAWAVERDVEGAMIFRRRGGFAVGPGIVRRKHAADEGDDGEGVGAVVADGVDIPPGVAAGAYCAVKTQFAAIRPEMAAIGRPGPGWTEPPAR